MNIERRLHGIVYNPAAGELCIYSASAFSALSGPDKIDGGDSQYTEP